MLLIKILASDWSVKAREKAINIPLNSNVISEIDKQIRGMKELKSKNVYLNEITLKAEAKGQTVDDMSLEMMYVFTCGKYRDVDKFKRYTYTINLTDKIIEKVTINGSLQLSGYKEDLFLNSSYKTFDDYLRKIMNSEQAFKYVMSESSYDIRLIFRHYDKPYHAIVSNENSNVKISME